MKSHTHSPVLTWQYASSSIAYYVEQNKWFILNKDGDKVSPIKNGYFAMWLIGRMKATESLKITWYEKDKK